MIKSFIKFNESVAEPFRIRENPTEIMNIPNCKSGPVRPKDIIGKVIVDLAYDDHTIVLEALEDGKTIFYTITADVNEYVPDCEIRVDHVEGDVNDLFNKTIAVSEIIEITDDEVSFYDHEIAREYSGSLDFDPDYSSWYVVSLGYTPENSKSYKYVDIFLLMYTYADSVDISIKKSVPI